MEKISSTVSKWPLFQTFNEPYVFNGLLLLNTDHSSRSLKTNCAALIYFCYFTPITKWQPLNNFNVLLMIEVTRRNVFIILQNYWAILLADFWQLIALRSILYCWNKGVFYFATFLIIIARNVSIPSTQLKVPSPQDHEPDRISQNWFLVSIYKLIEFVCKFFCNLLCSSWDFVINLWMVFDFYIKI